MGILEYKNMIDVRGYILKRNSSLMIFNYFLFFLHSGWSLWWVWTEAILRMKPCGIPLGIRPESQGKTNVIVSAYKMPLSGYREWKNILIFQFNNIWWKLFHLLHDEVFRANIIRYGFLSGYYLSFALSLLPVLHGVVSEAIQFLSWLFIR